MRSHCVAQFAEPVVQHSCSSWAEEPLAAIAAPSPVRMGIAGIRKPTNLQGLFNLQFVGIPAACPYTARMRSSTLHSEGSRTRGMPRFNSIAAQVDSETGLSMFSHHGCARSVHM